MGVSIFYVTPLLLILLQTGFGQTRQHPCDNVAGDFNSWYDNAVAKDVVVVGGGASGLSAMKQLLKEGPKQIENVILLEAQDYLGGRVKTVRSNIPSTGKTVLTEDGAEWVHGGTSTPLYRLAKLELNALAEGNKIWDIFLKRTDGQEASEKGIDSAKDVLERCEWTENLLPYYENAEDTDYGYGQCPADEFDSTYISFGGPRDEKEAWYFYLQQRMVKDIGSDDWLDQSARDGEHFEGDDKWDQWKNGYDTLIKSIKESIPDAKVKMSSPVCRIYWDEPDLNNQALVVTKSGESFLAKHVLTTASVGYIKEKHQQLFIPTLPQEYLKTLSGVELGVADKVQLGFEWKWWGNEQLELNIIWTEMQLPREREWLYGIIEFLSIHQMPEMIQAFIAGKYAKMMEELPEETVKRDILWLLRTFMKAEVPEPVFFRRTTWGKNEFTFGSYNSYITREGSNGGIRDRTPLAMPIHNSQDRKVLFWAGEHTNAKRYGTVDGAMAMGANTAEEIQRLLRP